MFNLRFIKQTDFKDTCILYYNIFCFHYLFQNVVMYNFLRINITATSECNSLGFDSKHLRLMDVRLLTCSCHTQVNDRHYFIGRLIVFQIFNSHLLFILVPNRVLIRHVSLSNELFWLTRTGYLSNPFVFGQVNFYEWNFS